MITIGELSRSTAISVKTIRYYQEMGILEPVKVDNISGYRYYDHTSFDRVSSIILLKDLGFTIKEIKNILDSCSVEKDLKSIVKAKIKEIRATMKKLKEIEGQLTSLENQIEMVPEINSNKIEEIELNIPHYISVSIEGRYQDIGKGFKILYKSAGRYTKGAPYAFYNDMEYKEEGASMEAVVEVRKKLGTKDGVKYSSLENRKAVKLIHKGSYGKQGETYLKLFEYCNKKGFKPTPPIIEHYIKGPGLIFKGNPENYLTECIILLE